jgi:arylsulfatase A-like enzyme
MKTMYALLATCLLACPISAAQPPNIVFILADDLGWTDTTPYGTRYYETPNIQKLADQGVRFTNHHHCQNCQPTRAALMTGQYAPRTGVYTVGGIDRFDWQTRPLRPVDNVDKLPLDKITVAQQLKKAGYVTGMFGKWHLGDNGDHHPGRRGFDEAIVTAGQHFDFVTTPRTDYPKGQYLADFLTDKAEDFIRRQKDKPFFLYLPHFGVHSPFQSREDDKNRFVGKPAAGGHHDPTYAGMIYAVDRSVGRVMAVLEELKLTENTVVIFASDNGGVGGYSRPDGLIRETGVAPPGKGKGKGEQKDTTDNAPLRSGKGALYEGGTRVPLIVRWPGVARPGSQCDQPTIHVDLFPTFLEITSAPAPQGQVLDGQSLVGLMRDSSASLKRAAIFQHCPGYLGSGPGLWRTTPVGVVHSGDWKLMEYFEDGRLELYNLKDDLGETRNRAAEMPQKAQELRQMMAAWRQSVDAKMPTPHTPGAKTEPAEPKKKKNKKKEAAGK